MTVGLNMGSEWGLQQDMSPGYLAAVHLNLQWSYRNLLLLVRKQGGLVTKSNSVEALDRAHSTHGNCDLWDLLRLHSEAPLPAPGWTTMSACSFGDGNLNEQAG